MAQFPERLAHRLEKRIKDMENGDFGFTQPWALSIDQETNECYLNAEYTLEPALQGTACMLVQKLGDGTISVDIRQVYPTFTWHRSQYYPELSWWAIPVDELVS